MKTCADSDSWERKTSNMLFVESFRDVIEQITKIYSIWCVQTVSSAWNHFGDVKEICVDVYISLFQQTF